MTIDFRGPNSEQLGTIGHVTWEIAARMMPVLIDTVNLRCVDEAPWPHQPLRDENHPPLGKAFALDSFLRDESLMDDIVITDPAEMLRLLDWCDYLLGTNIRGFHLFAPLVQDLHRSTRRLDELV